ncbi:MAG: protein-export chaperone SecB [Pseudomonadota bacterium]
MTDTPNGNATSPESAEGATPEDSGFRAQVMTQYIKDLSFENPQVKRILEGPPEDTKLTIEVNVNARRVQDGLFEVQIDFTASAKGTERAVYQLELIYGGLFQIENLPQDALEPFLLVNCPALLFPFLRRIVADLTREGGFEPLLLDPVDFGQLYLQRKRAGSVQTAAAEN